jgi:MSHA pilin protein MshD
VRPPALLRSHGFSLIELILTIVVLAIALTVIFLALDTSIAHSADPMVESQAVAIGQAYLGEILDKSYTDLPCPAACTQADYNDIDDYNGLVNDGAENQFGQPIAGLAAYDVRVTVTDTTLYGVPAKRITVTVTHTPDVDLTLAAYATGY